MAEAQEAPKSAKEVLRYATEQLHALRPQPAGIPEALDELKRSLQAAEVEAKAEKEEDPPKDVGEAVSRIDAAVGKMAKPPKEKADLKAALGEKAEAPKKAGPSPAK